eukprot:787957_1
MDPRGELLVFGYARAVQNSLEFKSLIPTSIIELCFKFYFEEHFTAHGPNITLDTFRRTVTKHAINNRRTRSNSVYGNIQIGRDTFGIFSWSFKLLSLLPAMIYFGIDSSNKQCTNCNLSKKCTFYTFGWQYHGQPCLYDHYAKTSCAAKHWGPFDVLKIE